MLGLRTCRKEGQPLLSRSCLENPGLEAAACREEPADSEGDGVRPLCQAEEGAPWGVEPTGRSPCLSGRLGGACGGLHPETTGWGWELQGGLLGSPLRAVTRNRERGRWAVGMSPLGFCSAGWEEMAGYLWGPLSAGLVSR